MTVPRRPSLRIVATIVLASGASALAGCQGTPSTSESVSSAGAPDSTAIDATSADAGTATPGPMNERDARRAREWEAAIRGLRFDRDRVTVEAPPPADDLAAAAAHMEKGRARMRTNHRTESVAAWAEAVRAAPHHAPAYAGLGMAMRGKGKGDLAVASFRTAIDLDPGDLESRYQLGLQLSMERRKDEAVAVMEALLELDPTQGQAHERLAVWSYYAGDFAAAWEHVHAALELGANVPPQLVDLLARQMPEPR